MTFRNYNYNVNSLIEKDMKKENVVKSFIFVGLVAGVITLSGCGEKINQLKDVKNDVTSKVDSGKQMVEDSKGMIGGLKDAMKKGVAMKCEDTENNWVTYTNGTKMRSEGMENGKKQVVLVTDGTTYTWDEATKTGFKMDKKCLENFQKDMGFGQEDMPKQQYEDDFTIEELETKEETGSIKCTPSTEADFSVPSDVKFEDQCEMLKEQMAGYKEQMKKMQNEIPSM